MKFDRSNKFDLCYYGKVSTIGGNIYFAGDGTPNNFPCTRAEHVPSSFPH